MTDDFISFLKDDATTLNLSLYFIVGLIILLILKPLLKSKINPFFFDRLISVITIITLILVVGNIIITKSYNRLWNVVFVVAVIFSQKIVPKIVKWYDNKVDKLSERM